MIIKYNNHLIYYYNNTLTEKYHLSVRICKKFRLNMLSDTLYQSNMCYYYDDYICSITHITNGFGKNSLVLRNNKNDYIQSLNHYLLFKSYISQSFFQIHTYRDYYAY